ncbi:MAG: 23S rRNA methyltransferase [candidate division TM6 bacterium GW2011_GWE2_41_16]|nr:MAG: 23S rRNA methyltransferase [candidate division TM6 bacterium GW2011_GWE2_41_16]
MKKIISAHHEVITLIGKLDLKKYRTHFNLFKIEGERAIDQALTSYPDLLYTLVCTEQSEPLTQKWSDRIANKTVQIPSQLFAKITNQTNSQEILGIFTQPNISSLEKLSSGIVLNDIRDPGNMGTLIRTAQAFGAESIVIIDGVDPFSPKVVAATAGALLTAPLIICSWLDLVQHASLKQIALCGLILESQKSIFDLQVRKRLMVIGNEAQGLSREHQEDCIELVTIPMSDHVESLNAAIAGSLALYTNQIILPSYELSPRKK